MSSGLAESVARATPLPSPGLRRESLFRDISYEDWLRLGEQLVQQERFSQWAMADWLFGGESITQRFTPEEHSRRLSDAARITGYAEETLRGWLWAGSVFGQDRRRFDLSFSHYRALAGHNDEAEQDFWLERAEREQWSVRRLKDEIKGGAGSAPGQTPPEKGRGGASESDDAWVKIPITIPESVFQMWEDAVAKTGITHERQPVRNGLVLEALCAEYLAS